MTMTPVALLVVFCAAMAAIAIWQLAVDDTSDRVDLGSALVVVGITFLSGLWVALTESLLTMAGQAVLGVIGLTFVAIGVVVIGRYWSEPPDSNAPPG